MQPTARSTRRQFLTDSIAATAAAGAFAVTTQAQSEKKPTSRPSWCIACRDAHLSETGEPNFLAAMDAIGVEGVEATVTLDGKCPGLFGETPFSIATADGVKKLGQALQKRNKTISAFCLHNRFDEQPGKELECVIMTARAAADLGTPAIRLDVVPRRFKDDEERFLEFAIDMGKRVVDTTADTGVRFGVENHGHTTNKPKFLQKLFGGIGSPRFGLTLDTGNFYWYGFPLSKLYPIYRTFAPTSCHTHCKSICYPEAEREKQRTIGWEYGKYSCPVDRGDIDFTQVVDILRNANYRGDLCIENESLTRFPKEQRGEILKREAAFLRKLAETA